MKKLSEKDIELLRLKGEKIERDNVFELAEAPKPTAKPSSDQIKSLALASRNSVKVSEEIVRHNKEMTATMMKGLESMCSKLSILSKPVPTPAHKLKEWEFKISRNDMGYIQSIRAKEV